MRVSLWMSLAVEAGGKTRRERRAVHGLMLLDKPAGGSSNKALQKAKWLLHAKKAGHTGSLDPLATGMLPLCFGEATKLSPYFLNADKGYQTTLQLGITTDSADADGVIVDQRPVPQLSAAEFEAVCAPLRGAIKQTPPMVSALKVDGKRLYKLAREGITVERKARDITVHRLDVLSFDAASGTASLRVECSKGTYIRSIVTDIGEAIGCGAHVIALRRTHVSPFQNAPMVTLSQLEESKHPEQYLLPLDTGLDHLPAAKLSVTGLAAFRNGQSAEGEWMTPDLAGANPASLPVEPQPEALCHEATSDPSEALVRIYNPQDQFIGLGNWNGSGLWAPRRVLQI